MVGVGSSDQFSAILNNFSNKVPEANREAFKKALVDASSDSSGLTQTEVTDIAKKYLGTSDQKTFLAKVSLAGLVGTKFVEVSGGISKSDNALMTALGSVATKDSIVTPTEAKDTLKRASSSMTSEIRAKLETIAGGSGSFIISDKPVEALGMRAMKTKADKNTPTQQDKSISFNPLPSLDDNSSIKNLKNDFQNNIKNLAINNEDNFRAILKQSFGSKISDEKIDELVKKAKEGNFPIPENIKFVKQEILQGNLAAYSSSENGTIFLNENLKDNKDLLLHAFTEEAGHYLDDLIGGNDSQGDEGEIFSKGIQKGEPISQEELEIAKADTDKGIIEVDGKKVEVEFIAPVIIAVWVAKIAEQTVIDGAIDIAIAAISGMPPPTVGSHLLNAGLNAIPVAGELNTLKKFKNLKNAIDVTIESFNNLKNIPSGRKILTKIDDIYKELEAAVSKTDLPKAKEKLIQLVTEIKNAQTVSKNIISKIPIKSNVKSNSKISKLAEETFKGNQQLRTEANNLMLELTKGNITNPGPGIGTKPVFGNILEARSRNGARVYFQYNKEKGITIVGYSNKSNQQTVINTLKGIYK